jgi:hypothetical protein
MTLLRKFTIGLAPFPFGRKRMYETPIDDGSAKIAFKSPLNYIDLHHLSARRIRSRALNTNVN